MAEEQESVIAGFIITRQWQESDRGIILSFWLATERGPLRLQVDAQEAVCFVPSQHRQAFKQQLQALGNWRSQPSSLKDFSRQPVDTLYFRSQRQLLDARDRLQQAGIAVLEADIKPTDRFLMERFITGGVQLSAALRQRKGYLEARNARLQALEYRPRLKALSIDIETDLYASQLYSIACFGDGLARVCMISSAPEAGSSQNLKDDKGESFRLDYYANEAELLQAFVELLADYDPDLIMGWNVVNFDLRCLQDFADRAGMSLPLGRAAQKMQWRQARDNKDRHYVLIPGRAVLDGIELLRSATYSFENFSLEHVSRQLLNRGKLVTDVDQRGHEITEQFQQDKPALAAYNLEDCRLVWDIFQQENLQEFAIERSLLTGLELDRYGGSVAALDFLYLPRLHRQGYVAPAIGQQQSDNISPGGYVMQSIPGIHDNVAVLDFKSLYPSIIRTFRVDPLALVRGQQSDDAIPGYDGGVFARGEAILPGLIETLWAARDRAKQQNNQELSQAIKIIMNSFYGVLGTRACRFLDARLVSSITKRGHQIIIESKQQIEKQGYQVIYGDTDSVFVLIGSDKADSPEAAQAIARKLADKLNQYWQDKLAADYQIESFLEMEFETLYTRFLMPTIRGSDAGSKKRYAGMTGDGALQFKGLESVRSDWSLLARQFQQRLYEKIFTGQEYRSYIQDLVQDLRAGKFEDELVLRKRLRRKLQDYVKNVPPHVQAARKAEAIRREKGLPGLYESGGWIEYLMTSSGPEPRQYRQSAIDYDFYIEKQLAPIADAILVFEGQSMEKVLTQQIGLF